jgi:hypothetical protein
LGHAYQQYPVFSAGGILVCNTQARHGVTPVLIYSHESGAPRIGGGNASALPRVHEVPQLRLKSG